MADRVGALERAIVAAAPALAKILAELAASSPASETAAPWLEERLVADRFGLEPRALASARRRGELAGRRVGRRVLLELDAVEKWIVSSRGTAVETAKATPIDAGLAAGRLRRIGGAR